MSYLRSNFEPSTRIPNEPGFSPSFSPDLRISTEPASPGSPFYSLSSPMSNLDNSWNQNNNYNRSNYESAVFSKPSESA